MQQVRRMVQSLGRGERINRLQNRDAEISITRAIYESEPESFDWSRCQSKLDEFSINRFLSDVDGIFLLNTWVAKFTLDFKEWFSQIPDRDYVLLDPNFICVSMMFVELGVVDKMKIIELYHGLIFVDKFQSHISCKIAQWHIFVQFPEVFMDCDFIKATHLLKRMLKTVSQFVSHDVDRRSQQIINAFIWSSNQRQSLLSRLHQSKLGGELLWTLIEEFPRFFVYKGWQERIVIEIFSGVQFKGGEPDVFLQAVLKLPLLSPFLLEYVPLTDALAGRLMSFAATNTEYKQPVLSFFIKVMKQESTQSIGVWWYYYSFLCRGETLSESLLDAINLLNTHDEIEDSFWHIGVEFWIRVYREFNYLKDFQKVWHQLLIKQRGDYSLMHDFQEYHPEFVSEMQQNKSLGLFSSQPDDVTQKTSGRGPEIRFIKL
jgi:hypothetical protein